MYMQTERQMMLLVLSLSQRVRPYNLSLLSPFSHSIHTFVINLSAIVIISICWSNCVSLYPSYATIWFILFARARSTMDVLFSVNHLPILTFDRAWGFCTTLCTTICHYLRISVCTSPNAHTHFCMPFKCTLQADSKNMGISSVCLYTTVSICACVCPADRCQH